MVWFLTPDNALDHRLALQLPPRDTLVRWDERPFVSPLVDVLDRGRPAGIVLVSAEAVRLLHWEAGRVEEPHDSVYELELGRWRDYDAYARGHLGRSGTGMHVATLDQRVQEWRQRFLREAATATGEQLGDLGWHRVLLAGEPRSLGTFVDSLPGPARERVVATIDANLLWEEPAAVAERLADEVGAAWRREAHALVEQAIRAAHEGGAGALDWAAVLDTLVQHRVEHLVFATHAAPDPAQLAPHTAAALGSPSRALLVERAVEHAIVSGAQVTALPEPDAGPLTEAGGVAATLRY